MEVPWLVSCYFSQPVLGFTLYDALHLAFAEASDATVFLTTDDRLLRKAISYAGNIKVRVSNPVTWLMENQE